MSNLIITLISIALIGLVSLSVLFFGGDEFRRGSEDAQVARYLNESNQIAGAVRYYQAENGGELPTDLEADLVSHYLTEMPRSGEDWGIGENVLVKSVSNANMCERINTRAGFDDPTPKQCDDSSLSSESYYCCIDDA